MVLEGLELSVRGFWGVKGRRRGRDCECESRG